MGHLILLVLILFYFFLLAGCNMMSRKIVITPEFIFIACFLPQMTYALFYVDKWNLVLSADTFFVYLLGGLMVVVFSFVFKWMFHINDRVLNITPISNNDQSKRICIDKWKLIFFLIIQIIAIILFIKTLRSITGQSSISESIAFYNIASKSAGVTLPFLPGKLHLLSYLSGFVWIYYLVHALVYKYKTYYILLSANLFLSILSNLVTGSRGGVVQNIIVGVVLFYFFIEDKRGWKKIPTKYIMRLVLLFIALIALFQWSLQLVGRASNIDTFGDYIALYISAEMKNLDMKIRAGNMGFNSLEDSRTLSGLISLASEIFGFDVNRRFADISTYNTYNGIELGNVYTIFYAFITDLHYLGLVIFPGLMAFISQLSLKAAIKPQTHRSKLEMGKLIYAYLITQTMFSFFSDWFFDSMFSTGFIWTLFIWYAIYFFMDTRHIVSHGRLKIG